MFLNGKIKKKVPFLVLTFTFTFAKLIHSSVGSTQKSTGNYFHAFYSLVKIYSFKAAKPQKKGRCRARKIDNDEETLHNIVLGT